MQGVLYCHGCFGGLGFLRCFWRPVMGCRGFGVCYYVFAIYLLLGQVGWFILIMVCRFCGVRGLILLVYLLGYVTLCCISSGVFLCDVVNLMFLFLVGSLGVCYVGYYVIILHLR